MGVTEASGVIEGPFPMMHTVLFLRLDSGLSFFDLILAYMSLLNLVVISAKGKHLKKRGTMKLALANLTFTLISFNFKVAQDEGRRFRP